MDARKKKDAACFHLDLSLITMHTERTTGRTSCSTRQARKRDQEKLWKIRSVARVDFPARDHEWQMHRWSSPKGWKSRQRFTPPAFCGSCTRAASWAAS